MSFRAALLLIPFLLCAQDAAEQHPVERASRACLDRASSTEELIACAKKSVEAWNAEVVKNVADLAAVLDAPARTALETAQKEWLRFREAETKSINAIYGDPRSILQLIQRAEDQVAITKNRALDLARWRETVEETRKLAPSRSEPPRPGIQ